MTEERADLYCAVGAVKYVLQRQGGWSSINLVLSLVCSHYPVSREEAKEALNWLVSQKLARVQKYFSMACWIGG